jgi:AcrR family transcriptional regulator
MDVEWDEVEAQPGKRQTATQRRRAAIQAAIVEFATYGYHGGSTERIAAEAGISQAYVLRLFGSKKALFMAAVEHVGHTIFHAGDDALYELPDGLERQPTPEERLQEIKAAYSGIIYQVGGMPLILQACAASADVDIQVQIQEWISDMFGWIRGVTGATYEQVQALWASIMMMTVGTSIGANLKTLDTTWARMMMMQAEQSPDDFFRAYMGGTTTALDAVEDAQDAEDGQVFGVAETGSE